MNTKNNFIAKAMKYNKIVLLLISTFIIFGVYALFKMPKQEFPSFTIRQGVVVAVYPGATAEEVEEQVAKPLENYLFTYKEIKKNKTYSQSKDGILYVFVELNDDVKNKTEVWSKIKLGLSNFKMQIFHQVFSARFQICQYGSTVANFLEIIQTKFYIYRICHGDQVHYGIGRTAQNGDHRHSVFKGFSGHNVFGFDVFFQQGLNGFSGIETFHFFIVAQC
jgi:hypothetical protein